MFDLNLSLLGLAREAVRIEVGTRISLLSGSLKTPSIRLVVGQGAESLCYKSVTKEHSFEPNSGTCLLGSGKKVNDLFCFGKGQA